LSNIFSYYNSYITVEATEVGPISVNSSEDEHIFVPGTVVNMTCTGTVGNPPGNLHWCYKRYGLDVDFIEYPSEMDVTWENVTQIGCQFSQLSVLSYTLSNEWSNIIFLCEAGLNNTCGGPESISTNYAINLGKYFLIYLIWSPPMTSVLNWKC
jgi:hypothetical protein